MKSVSLQSYGSIIAIAASLASVSAAEAQTSPTQAAPAQAAPPPAAAPRSGPADKGNEVVVIGTRSDVTSSTDRVSFNIANDLQVQTGTLADALRAVPGVEVDLQGRVSLRGDPGVTILIDGRPSAMMREESRADVLLSMPAGRIERVEVITNPSAALSPEGSGGVINLVTKQARKNSTSGSVRASFGGKGRGGLNLNGAHSAGPLTLTGDVAYRRITGTARGTQLRSRLDPATGGFVNSRQDSELKNRNSARLARVGVEYDLDKKNRISTDLSFRQASGDIDRADSFVSPNAGASFQRDSNMDLLQRGGSARASWRRTLPGKDHELVADVEAERGRMRRQLEAETVFAGGQRSFERIRNAAERSDSGVKLDYKRPLGKDGSLNLGYHGSFIETEFESSGSRGATLGALLPVPGLNNMFDYDQTIHAWFGTYRFDLGKLDAQAGLRLEQANITIDQLTDDITVENDYFRAYPTLHLGYELSRTEQLRASYSRRIQRPSPQDLNPYTFYIDPLNLRRGNPFLKPEVTDSFELALQHRKAGTFYSLTGFYRRARGGVTDILSDLGSGVFLTTRANLATAERVGAEMVANGRLSKTLTYNMSGTFLWNQIDPRVGGVSAPRSGTTGTVRGNLSWQPTPNDFFQLNGFYSGRQLLPQGYRGSGGLLNLGYRRKVNERLSLLVTVQDVLETAKQVTVFETAAIRDRLIQRGPGRIAFLGLTYNFGGQNGRRRQEPGFEFQQTPVETPQ